MMAYEKPDSLNKQVGGDHYARMAMQPVELIEGGECSFLAGCVIKRLCRFDAPGGKGVQDLEKVCHEIELLLQLRYKALVKMADDLYSDQFDETRFKSEHEFDVDLLDRFLVKNRFTSELRGHVIDLVFWADQLRGLPEWRDEAVLLFSAAWIGTVELKKSL